VRARDLVLTVASYAAAVPLVAISFTAAIAFAFRSSKRLESLSHELDRGSRDLRRAVEELRRACRPDPWEGV